MLWTAEEEVQTNLARGWKIDSQSLVKDTNWCSYVTDPPPHIPPNEQMFPFRLSSQEQSSFSRERNAFYYHLNRRRVAGWSCAFAKKPKPSPKARRLTRGEVSVNGQVVRTQRQRDRCLFNFSSSRVKARRCFSRCRPRFKTAATRGGKKQRKPRCAGTAASLVHAKYPGSKETESKYFVTALQ